MAEIFGDYHILKEIGRGVSSRVFSASKGDTQYAVKIFDGFSSRINFEQHRNEYTILKLLDHKNIVKVHKIGKIDDQSYLVMDLVVGDDLADLVRRIGPLEIVRARELAHDVAAALDYARLKQVVHGDVKPSNIIIAKDGRAVLGDFGLARISPPLEHMTPAPGTRTSLGTTDFMAPEVLNDGVPTWSSDLYSLAAVIYFALSGRLPSDGRTIYSRANDRVVGKIVPLTTRNPLVPSNIAEVVHRGLAPDPKQRFESCEDFYAALTVAHTPIMTISPEEKIRATTEAGDGESKKFDFYRYIIIPLIVAVIGGIATAAKLLFG